MNASAGSNESYVEVPGGKLFVKTWAMGGSQSSVPLFLMHDSIGCVEMWRDFPAVLSNGLGRTVIAYDRLGFGKSSPQLKTPVASFISDEAKIYFPLVVEQLKIKEFDIFGHSVGGGMAVNVAAYLPGRCRALVTEASQAYVEDRTLEGIRKAKAEFLDPKKLDKLRKFHGEKAEWVLSSWVDVWLSPEFSGWSLADVLPKVQCPLLVIHGDKDEYGSLKFPEMIAGMASGKTRKVILENCGHVPHKEREKEVIGLVSGFLNSV